MGSFLKGFRNQEDKSSPKKEKVLGLGVLTGERS